MCKNASAFLFSKPRIFVVFGDSKSFFEKSQKNA